MAGRAKTRAKMTAICLEAGIDPPAKGKSLKPIIDAVAEAAAAAAKVKAKAKQAERSRANRAKAKAAKEKAEAKAAPRTAPVPVSDSGDAVTVSPNDIKRVLREILLSTREPGAARIAAATKLLEIDGTAPQFQKALLEVRLTSYAPNQYELDLQRHREKVASQ